MSNTPPVPNNNNPQGSNPDQNLPQQQQTTAAQPQAPLTQAQAQAALAQAQAQAAAVAGASPADIDKMVATYLQKKGYKATEIVFIRESRGEIIRVEDVIQVTPANGDAATATTTAANEESSNSNNSSATPNANRTTTSRATSVGGAGAGGGGDAEDQVMEEASSVTSRTAAAANEDDSDVYDVSYKSLREWIENSLDWYKPELRSVLFPIFVHSYLDLVGKSLPNQAKHFMDTYKLDHVELHTLDLNRLSTVTEPQHIKENELAQMYRNNKYNLRMSSVPFELFLNYLQDNKFMLLLRIVNQYLNIQVVHGKLLKSAGGLEMDDVIGITGHQTQQIEEFNKQSVQLGFSQLGQQFRDEVEQAIKEKESSNNNRENIKDEANADQPTPMTINDHSPLLDTFKKVIQETTADGPAFGDIPLPPYRGTDILAEIESLKNLNHRMPLNESSLPTICCYTFHNTHDSLNCVTTSKDATLIAGGFSESFIKIWSLKGEKLKSLRNTINPAHVNDYNDLNRQREKHGSEYKKLVGHAGSVYGLSFSPDNKYLVSCSEDKTARLWSTQTFSNLVVYKGHNSPVWDVDFGPFGFYFATASHDRTARIWSCDQIHPLRIFAGHLSDVDTVKFHPNSKYLVTGSSDRTSRLWDVQKGTCVRVFTGHTGAIKTVAVSPNGRLMASAGDDRSIMLWDLGSGKRIKKMTGHTGLIYSLNFSADNNVLVSGGADSTVRVWDINNDTTEPSSTNYMDTAASEQENGSKRFKFDDSDENNSRKRTSKKAVHESREQLAVFPTKQTPIYDVQFTNRNLCLVAGAFTSPKVNEH